MARLQAESGGNSGIGLLASDESSFMHGLESVVDDGVSQVLGAEPAFS
jgi:hypothetical protein